MVMQFAITKTFPVIADCPGLSWTHILDMLQLLPFLMSLTLFDHWNLLKHLDSIIFLMSAVTLVIAVPPYLVCLKHS